jgi:hypothetical protein
MESVIAAAFMARGGWARAELIGRAREYIDNDMFINALNSIDINEMNPANMRRSCGHFVAFNSVPGLALQVRKWLNS